MTRTEDTATAAWKNGVDAWWRALEAVTEGARKLHEIQLEAAVEAHACAEASRKQFADAADPQAALRIQADWLSRNVADCQAYWRRVAETAGETQAAVTACLCGQPMGVPPTAGAAGTQAAMLGMMDKAYQQWLETTRQLYAGAMPK